MQAFETLSIILGERFIVEWVYQLFSYAFVGRWGNPMDNLQSRFKAADTANPSINVSDYTRAFSDLYIEVTHVHCVLPHDLTRLFPISKRIKYVLVLYQNMPCNGWFG